MSKKIADFESLETEPPDEKKPIEYIDEASLMSDEEIEELKSVKPAENPPFLATDNKDFADGFSQDNPSKPNKVLTNLNPSGIIKAVKKKGRQMVYEKNKKSNKKVALSAAWLVEATFRAFIGWVLLSNFDNLVTTIAAFYALGTAGLIVVTHFVNAHK